MPSFGYLLVSISTSFVAFGTVIDVITVKTRKIDLCSGCFDLIWAFKDISLPLKRKFYEKQKHATKKREQECLFYLVQVKKSL